MIYVGPLQVDERIVERAAKMLREPEGLEGLLSWMRSQGEDKIGSMKVLVRVSGMNLGQAKRAVHLSKAWADMRSTDDVVQDSLQQAAQELSYGDGHPRVA